MRVLRNLQLKLPTSFEELWRPAIQHRSRKVPCCVFFSFPRQQSKYYPDPVDFTAHPKALVKHSLVLIRLCIFAEKNSQPQPAICELIQHSRVMWIFLSLKICESEFSFSANFHIAMWLTKLTSLTFLCATTLFILHNANVYERFT